MIKKLAEIITILPIVFVSIVVSLGLFFVFFLGSAYAIPELQLYIEDSTYDFDTETWVISDTDFILWVLGDVGAKGDIKAIQLSAAYPTDQNGTITLIPSTATSGKLPSPGDTSTPSPPYYITSGDGTAPLMGDLTPLPSHGIFGPGTSWNTYSLGDFTLTDSPIGDYIYSLPSSWPDMGQINAYNVKITGFTMVHFDVFDHYLKNNPHNDVQYVKAPFSHDSEGGGGGGGGQEVPEPGTLMLLGSGLLGVAFCLRKKLNK